MKIFLLIFAFSALVAGKVEAQQSTLQAKIADVLFHKLVLADITDDYDSFVEDGTTGLKAALTKTQFDAASQLMRARTNSGYDIDSLGMLNQRGLQVFLYRLRFKDGGDDILGTMSLKDGKVAGILFK